ncbi:MAG: DUF6089 family protein [Cyclobacteriaceae bacterium]|nr:DUF6089 family protein [Cyclobacteriaceae bacterium]
MKQLIKLTLTILLAFTVSVGFSQINRKQIKRNNKAMANFKGKKNGFTKQKKYYYISAGLNSMNYFGDIAPKSTIGSTKISSTRLGFSGAFGYRIGPRYTLQASLSFGTLFSDDNKAADPTGENSNYRYKRNLHFKNNITELAIVGIFDLFQNQGSYLSRVQITPYAMIGIAGFYHSPQALVSATNAQTGGAPLAEADQWVKLQPLGTEGQYADLLPTDANFGIKPYSLWQMSIPFGLGARYKLGEALDISFDITFRYLFFDYIDDISRNYVDLDVLDSDLARAMSDRSVEPTGAKSGDDRSQYISGWDIDPYTGRNGGVYNTVNGFGQEGVEGFPNNRGGASDNDIYYVTSVKISYILGSSFRRAKFR